MTALHERVAKRCAAAEIAITPAGVEEIERMLSEERLAAVIDRESDPGSWAEAIPYLPSSRTADRGSVPSHASGVADA